MLNTTRAIALFSVLAFAACAAIQQQQSQPVRADQGEFKNLKVLPQNITHDELLTTMRGFTRALGRKCDFCHVATPGGPEDFDFALDTKDHKRITRGMILMTRDAAAEIKRIGAKEGEQFKEMSCWTCHRGQVHPEATAPPRGEDDPPVQPSTPTPPAPKS